MNKTDNEAQALREQLAELSEEASSSEEQLDGLRQLADRRDKELESLRSASLTAKAQNDLLEAARKAKFTSPEDAAALLTKNLRLVDGKPMIVDQHGMPRFNRSGEPMTCEDLVQEFAASKPHWVLSNGGSLQDSRGGLGSVAVERIFGRTSDSRLAHQLARDNKPEYDRLKLIAKKAGLID